MNSLLNVIGFLNSWETVESLAVIVVFGMIALAIIDINRVKQNKKRAEYRKQRELARQIKLQKKIDEFEEFKSKVEEFEDCNGDCVECREFNYIRYENCKYKDEGYQNAKKYFDERGQTMRNIRITLQDYSVASVLELYGQA